jgi:catechol 2,3-dioxygenase-like lactoylglutathione lyase family enzyme
MTSTTEVMLRTADLEDARAFYFGALGFPIIMDSERVIGFDAGSFRLYFERGEPNGSVFEFEVDDVQRTKARLLEHGCSLVEENPALPRCYLRDPFGLIFNLDQRDQS